MIHTFRKHQVKAFAYAKPLARIALFMQMRLGKTLVAIRWATFNKLNKILVLCPNPVIPPWQGELDREGLRHVNPSGSLDERLLEVEGLMKKKGQVFVLINYEAVSLRPEFLDFKWDCIICDESTKLKNPQTEITKTLIKRANHIGYRAILSGLPNPESSMDYFSQMQFLHGNFMNETNFWHWRNKYCMQVGYDWVVKNCFTQAIRRAVRDRAFFMTREEAGIGGVKVYETRFVKPTLEQQSVGEQIDDDFAYDKMNGDGAKWTKYAPVKYLWLARVAGGFSPDGRQISNAKVSEIEDLLSGELRKDKVIIWFRFNHELVACYERLKKNFKCGIFMAGRKEGVTSTNELSPEIQVMCAQAKLGSRGMPWHASTAMIYYSNWYDGEVRAQSEDRGINMKKKEPYLIIDLVTKDTIDEHAVKLLKEKRLTSDAFMKKLHSIYSGMEK